jgi:hypothetical protein
MKQVFLLLLLITGFLLAQVPTYESPYYLYADGSQILLTLGNGSPLVTDWDGDGDKDLLLGRYSGGNILHYDNEGTNDSPILTYSGMMQAGGATLAVPYG